ncbi:hypothetical protein JXA12_04025 [Candidatus Woesearchaeota archaeon]|nr:hypothetical protein [Candidatus Woesearchaeota archaeon]
MGALEDSHTAGNKYSRYNKDNQEVILKARLEAHYLRDVSTDGTITIMVTGENKDLVALVEEAWKTNQPISQEERQEYMKRFTANKSLCHGLCRE